jgi:kynurenine formamidase
MRRIIDLTLALEPGMSGVAFEVASTVERDGWNARTLHLYSHAGTHMDAPVHYAVNTTSVDAIPLDRCLCPAWVADCGAVAPRDVLTPDHLGAVRDRVERGDGLLLKTGWSRRHGTPEYRTELPRIGDDLARWCVDRGIGLLGVEPPAVADVGNRDEITRIHRILLAADIVIVEGLTNLDSISKAQVAFVALPLKIAGGDGAPVRALAIEE